MRGRCSLRKLLLTIVLSHVLAIQGLLLAASGGLAIGNNIGDGITEICSGAAFANGQGTDPGGQNKHQDCLSACLSNRASGEPPTATAFLPLPAVYESWPVPQDAYLSPISEARAFLARAPPVLI